SQGERVSRWLPAAGEYRLDGEYGTREEDWLEGVAGVKVAGSGEVVVYDAASARIVVLSPDLKLVREFGREGRGPGELQPRSAGASWATRSSSCSVAGRAGRSIPSESPRS